MKGDFSRLTYDQEKRFSRVLMQQGRVQLDADWNEQASIFVESLRSLTADVIGSHGGMTATSFQIKEGETGFHIKKGRYYVQGIGCANDKDLDYDKQPHYPAAEPLTEGKYLVYLDVWERHVTATEDDSIREVALGGADTSSRGQIVWQVKTLLLDDHASGEVELRLKDLQRIEKGEALWPRNAQRVRERRSKIEFFFSEFAQSSVDYVVRFWIDFTNSQAEYLYARHEAIKVIFKTYKEKGIMIPFPIRTIYLNVDVKGEGKQVTFNLTGEAVQHLID